MAKKPKPKKQTISLHDVRTDGGTQPRVELDMGHVKELAEVLDGGPSSDFKDPIVVFNDGSNLWLADGFHRFHAYQAADVVEIKAMVHQGTQRDAVLYSVGANADHGLKRSNADKRQAVETLLADREWCQWSDREIGRMCHVDHTTVGKIRKDMTGDSTSHSRKYRDSHGRETTMDTTNIGKRDVPPAPADDPLDDIPSYDDMGDDDSGVVVAQQPDWKSHPLRGLISDGVVEAFKVWWKIDEEQATAGAWAGALRFEGVSSIKAALKENGAMDAQIDQALRAVGAFVSGHGEPDATPEPEETDTLKEAHASAAILRDGQTAIQKLRQLIKELDGKPVAAFLNIQDIDLHLKNAWAGIKFALPRHVCPNCEGAKCSTCRNTGWMPETHFKRYEAAKG